MQEIIEQLLGYLKGIWNNRWYAMATAWLICVIGWAVIYKMPDQYETKAKIYIDTQSLLKPLLRGLTVQTNINQQIRLMVRTLLSRPNVEKIIRLADLDLNTNSKEEFDELVKKLQKEIKFKKAGRGANLYDLLYADSDKKLGQEVLQSVITVFIENSIGETRDDSQSARKFLNKQIKLYEKRLVEAENRLKDFKQKNVGMLPSSGKDYYSRMQHAKQRLNEAELALKEAERQKEALQAEIEGEVPSFGLGTKRSMIEEMRTPYDARIESMEKNLDDLLLQFTEKHPDVISVRRVLASLKRKQAKALAEMKAEMGEDGNYELNENPVFQQLKINLGQITAKVATLKVRVEEYQKQYQKLNVMVNTIPEIEAQLKALNRDYKITKKQYDAFLSRRESAAISESVEQTTDSVQFKVIEAPRVEPEPVGPKRILLSSIILLAGLGIGVGVAFVISQVKPVVLSGRELSNMTGLPLLGSVSAITSPVQRKRRSLLVLSYVSLLLVLFAMYGLLVTWYSVQLTY